MHIRQYHGFIVISAREEKPQPDGDGYDHLVIFRDGSASEIQPTLADAIRLTRAAKERGYANRPAPDAGQPTHAQELKGAEPLTGADLALAAPTAAGQQETAGTDATAVGAETAPQAAD